MLVGRCVYAVCQFGILFLLARLGGVQWVGLWGLAMAITAPVFVFLQANLLSVVTADVKNTNHVRDYVGFNVATSATGLAVIGTVTIFMQFDPLTSTVVFLVALSKCVECISETYLGLMQRYERLDYCAMSFMIKGVGTVVVIAMLLYATGSFLMAMLGMITVWIGTLCFWDARIASTLHGTSSVITPRFSLWRTSQLARRVLPLGIAAVFVSLMTNIPRYLIDIYHGREMLGYYTALAYTVLIGDFVAGSVARSVISRFAQEFHSNAHQLIALSLKFLVLSMAIGGIGVAGAAIIGELYLSTVFGQDYAAHWPVLVWLMVGAVAAYSRHFVFATMVASESYKTWTLIAVCSAIVCFVTGLCWIPQFGMLGAAWAFVAASWCSLIISLIAGAIVFSRMSAPRCPETDAFA